MTDINGTGMKRAALINDLSCIGKCSLSVALPIISAFGAEAVALPTAVLSTHTGGFGEYVMRDMTQEMREFIAHWKRLNVKFDCIYTGFFSSIEQMEISAQFIRDFGGDGCLIIVDPVLGDDGALYGCFSDDFVAHMRALCRLADVITPNRTEAALLTGLDMDSPAEALLARLDAKNAIVTGVRRGDGVGYSARLDGERAEFFRPYLDIELHGTGDVFTSALCGGALSGMGMAEAFYNAAEFCDECVQETARRQPSHWYGLAFEEILRRRLFKNEQYNKREGPEPVVRKPSGAD